MAQDATQSPLLETVRGCRACASVSFGFTPSADTGYLKFPHTIGAAGQAPLLFMGINPRVNDGNSALYRAAMSSPESFATLAANRDPSRPGTSYIGRRGERHYRIHLTIVEAIFGAGARFEDHAAVTELFFCASADSTGINRSAQRDAFPCASRYFEKVLAQVMPLLVIAVGRPPALYLRTKRVEGDDLLYRIRVGGFDAHVLEIDHPNARGVTNAMRDLSVARAVKVTKHLLAEQKRSSPEMDQKAPAAPKRDRPSPAWKSAYDAATLPRSSHQAEPVLGPAVRREPEHEAAAAVPASTRPQVGPSRPRPQPSASGAAKPPPGLPTPDQIAQTDRVKPTASTVRIPGPGVFSLQTLARVQKRWFAAVWLWWLVGVGVVTNNPKGKHTASEWVVAIFLTLLLLGALTVARILGGRRKPGFKPRRRRVLRAFGSDQFKAWESRPHRERSDEYDRITFVAYPVESRQRVAVQLLLFRPCVQTTYRYFSVVAVEQYSLPSGVDTAEAAELQASVERRAAEFEALAYDEWLSERGRKPEQIAATEQAKLDKADAQATVDALSRWRKPGAR